ncbi:hypothetical protein CKA32_004942 [Geitlerinema sp. FC II]|nr:hypothetical protein CKA32_004942 [Geitlerinema sp. FC II]
MRSIVYREPMWYGSKVLKNVKPKKVKLTGNIFPARSD